MTPSPVRAWKEPLIIPTYRLGPAERDPMFFYGRASQGAKGPIYPYPLLDKLTGLLEDMTYEALNLENEYVRLCVLPELGGRIFSAVDKTDNYDFFYHQHVIKPALIGLIGAWISGGVEWNVPHHHRASTFMPVNYRLADNPDGSHTIWIGEIEVRHRMKWSVGLTLRPGRSFVEATFRILNRTPFAHSMLFWANVAVHATPDYQVLFPPDTEYATYHAKDQFSTWPISHQSFNGVDYTSGVDVSRWKNHPEPCSFFCFDSQMDFLAGYDHGRQAGTVHVADHHVWPGKKLFEWGNSEHARMWDSILTDADGPYIELMVGAYSDNQPDYSWLQPFETRSFDCCWYPIRGIGGVKQANREAALNLEFLDGHAAKLGLNATARHAGARAVLKAADRVVWEQDIDIGPDTPFVAEIPLPDGVREEDLLAVLSAPDGQALVAYRPVHGLGRPMPEPVIPPLPPQEVATVEELYYTALRLEQFHNPALEPYPYYQEALRRDPDDSRTNTALAILYCKRAMYAEAEKHLATALKRPTERYTRPKDGEALYYLGVALRGQHKHAAAYDAFYRATWSYAWRSPAYYALAELACESGDLAQALDFVERSIATNAWNTRCLNLKSALLRRMGRGAEAASAANAALVVDPLDFWARYELVCLAAGTVEAAEALDALHTSMRDAVESYLELAVDYADAGLFDEAIDVLGRAARSDSPHLSRCPLVHYYLGYFAAAMGDGEAARRHYARAAEMPHDDCFPFQYEVVDALKHALAANPRDAGAWYLLGTYLCDLQPERAIAAWERAIEIELDFALAHRDLALAYGHTRGDLGRGIASLQRAIACDGQDPRFCLELDELYEQAGISAAQRLQALVERQDLVRRNDDALTRQASLLTFTGSYNQALDLMRHHHFHNWEGWGKIHDVYVDACLLRGRQHFRAGRFQEALADYVAGLEYPANLEVGRPGQDPHAPRIHYLIGTAQEASGEAQAAADAYARALSVRFDAPIDAWYYQGLALSKTGHLDEAVRLFEALIAAGQAQLANPPVVDFFGKFLGAMPASIQRAQSHYLVGLGYQGLGMLAEAQAGFAAALQSYPYHSWAKAQLEAIGTSERR